MTTQTHDTPVVMADAVIAQVIQLKDPDEAISSAIWWRVAELLRACTTATASGPHLTTTLLEHAFNATDDVLSSLSADSRAQHTRRPISMVSMPHCPSAPVTTHSRRPGAAACG